MTHLLIIEELVKLSNEELAERIRTIMNQVKFAKVEVETLTYNLESIAYVLKTRGSRL